MADTEAISIWYFDCFRTGF